GELARYGIPHAHREHDVVVGRDIGTILWPGGAFRTADTLHLIQVCSVASACQRRWWRGAKLVGSFDAERRHIPPVKQNAAGGRATRRRLPLARRSACGHMKLWRH